MSYVQVAEGNAADLINLGQWENLIDEGARGSLQIDCRFDVPASVIDALNSQLRDRGVPAVAEAHSPMLSITFQKGFPVLAVIAAVVIGLTVLAIMIVAWRLYREIMDIIPPPIQPVIGTMLPLAGIALVGIIIYVLIKGGNVASRLLQDVKEQK